MLLSGAPRADRFVCGGFFNGRRELPLTERGQQQARKLGQRLWLSGSRRCIARRSVVRRRRRADRRCRPRKSFPD